jgi:hypothetical protein
MKLQLRREDIERKETVKWISGFIAKLIPFLEYKLQQCIITRRACGGVVVEALRGFDSRWCHWIFSLT